MGNSLAINAGLSSEPATGIHSCEKSVTITILLILHFALTVQNNTRTISDQENEIRKEKNIYWKRPAFNETIS